MKVDIAIQSYRKPELLILTLLSLKSFSGEHIDTVFINDDGSSVEQFELLANDNFLATMSPIKVRIRKNSQRMGWWYTPIKKLRSKYKKNFLMFLKVFKYFCIAKNFGADKSNCRYQWAIEQSDKEYIYIIHDDMLFYNDVIGLYLEYATKGYSVVGDLGQCWRCPYSSFGCSPDKIIDGYRPSSCWPDFNDKKTKNRWPCRMNEWSLLLSRSVAFDLEKKEGVLFGNYDNHGDVAAYWFAMLVKHGYEFIDPLAKKDMKIKYYLHADGGSGHSAWIDQGDGIKKYDPEVVRDKLLKEYGLELEN